MLRRTTLNALNAFKVGSRISRFSHVAVVEENFGPIALYLFVQPLTRITLVGAVSMQGTASPLL